MALISVFTTATDPLMRGDLLFPSMASYEGFADELVFVDGSADPAINAGVHEMGNKTLIQINHPWPNEFKWPFIGEQFQRGYEAATSDWVIHCDLDFVFHERDYGKIRQALKDYPSAPAISFYKWQFIQPDRYNLKSRLVLAVNKAAYGDRIKFNGGGDLCQPTLDGNDFNIDELPQAGIPFYNYEHIFKVKGQTMADVGRMDRAYYRHFGRYIYGLDGTDKSAFDGWLYMMMGRYEKPSKKIAIDEHPKVMQQAILTLEPMQFGYSGFGYIGENSYVKMAQKG